MSKHKFRYGRIEKDESLGNAELFIDDITYLVSGMTVEEIESCYYADLRNSKSSPVLESENLGTWVYNKNIRKWIKRLSGNFIGVKELRNVLKYFPQTKAFFINLLTCIEDLCQEQKCYGQISEDDILYYLSLRSKTPSDMPFSIPVSAEEKLIRILEEKDRILQGESQRIRELIEMASKIKSILEKVSVAVYSLTLDEKVFIEKRYVELLPWTDVSEDVNFTEQSARNKDKQLMEKLTRICLVDYEQYYFWLDRVKAVIEK